MATWLALAVYGLLLVSVASIVWRRPILALYAWIVGLALHNAVMAALYGAGVHGSSLTAIQAWKEILLAVALARVAFDAMRNRRLAFRVHAVDVLALGFALIVCVYAVLPQHSLGGLADRSAIGLALKHDLIPVGAYFLGRSVLFSRDELVPLVWTLVGAAAAVVLVAAAGVAARAPLARVPENAMKFAVGTMLTTFGIFWATEGAGAGWPEGDAALPVVLAFVLLVSFVLVALLRRRRLEAAVA